MQLILMTSTLSLFLCFNSRLTLLHHRYENDKKNDKPDVVVSRKANVLCVACTVMPTQQGAVEATITLSGSSKPATGEMQFAVDVILRLGNVVEGGQK